MTSTVFYLAWLGAVLLITAYALVALLSLLPATSRLARSLLPNLISASITIGLTLGVLVIGGAVMLLFVLVLIARVNFEAASAAFQRPFLPAPVRQPLFAATFAALAVGGFGLALLAPFQTAVLVLAAMSAVAATGAILLPGRGVGVVLGLVAFPLGPVLVFALSARLPEYAALALATYMMVETFDSYALIGGKIWGRTPAFPTLSPNKTVEGLLIGAVMLLMTAALVGYFLPGLSPLTIAPLAVLTGALTIAGDLAASALKRRSGTKDFLPVSRVQGGMLDIYDAWIMAFSGVVLISLLLRNTY